jgi:transcriptional regulator with AAA-type ATPase domain
MMRLSSETLHASTVALDGRAVMISGPSGSGKSDLALRLLDRGFTSSATTRRSSARTRSACWPRPRQPFAASWRSAVSHL